MYKLKQKRISRYLLTKTPPRKLTVSQRHDGVWVIDFDPSNPPEVFFDTNVFRDLNATNVKALKQLQDERGFRYRYSMLNFVELASHLGDAPTEEMPNPFVVFRGPFRRMVELFVPNVLPSTETMFMTAVGLKHYLGPRWIVDTSSIAKQVQIIAEAKSLENLMSHGIDPAYYKKLRECDGESFLYLTNEAKKLADEPSRSSKWWGMWIPRFISFQIYRASSKRTRLEKLKNKEQVRVREFFAEGGGRMFVTHLRKLMEKAIEDGRNTRANDFYDMLQLLQLVNTNLLFVTDDRAFRQYYAGPRYHKVVPWKGFKASVGRR